MSCLLMGGQACVLYGAAEFSRDVDLAILAESGNLDRLMSALDELQAECIAVPPFEPRFLEMGLAVHFRCRRPDLDRMRVDMMSRMRGVDPFPELWARRTTYGEGDEAVDLLALPDLVRAKKTQRDKDWPMIAQLVAQNCLRHCNAPTPQQVEFWLRELRTPSMLIQQTARHASDAQRLLSERSLLQHAMRADETALQDALVDEMRREQTVDREYWKPLREVIEGLRHTRRRSAPPDTD